MATVLQICVTKDKPLSTVTLRSLKDMTFSALQLSVVNVQSVSIVPTLSIAHAFFGVRYSFATYVTSQVDCLWHSVLVTDHQVYQLLNTISSRQHTAYMSKYHEKYAVFSPVICCILVLLESYRANLQGILLLHRNCNLIFVLGNSE